MAKGNFIEYVISDDPNKYPNESEQDGYYYRKVTKVETEEQIVTAGTTPIEVNATSGKLMSKVTVNPTPTEEKTVTPTTENLIVAPVEGKQLSQVTVQGDANFLEENIAEGVTMWGKTGTHQGGGGDVVNGIVESYLANSETIDANTFVEFIGSGEDVSLITKNIMVSGIASYYGLCAVKLSETKVLVIRGHAGSAIAHLITIDGSSITVGSAVTLKTSGTLYVVDCVALTSEKVFVIWWENPKIQGLLLTINGDTITVTAESTSSVSLIGLSYSSNSAKLVRLSDESVLLLNQAGSSSSSTYLYGRVITTTNSTIAVGSYQKIGDGYPTSAILIENGKALLSATASSSSYTVILSISGTSITVGSINQYATSQYKSSYLIKLSSNTFINLLRLASNELGAIILKVSGTTVTSGAVTTLVSTSSSGSFISGIKLASGEVFITHAYLPDDHIYGSIVSISGDTITLKSTVTLISDNSYSFNDNYGTITKLNLLDLGNSNIGFIYCEGRYNPTFALLKDPGVNIIKSTAKIEGITKTIATTETAGEVWVLNPNA